MSADHDPYADLLGDRADEFRRSVLQAVADRGGVMDPNGRAAAMPNGAAIRFDNLARLLAGTQASQVRAKVEQFFDGLAAAPALPELTWDELRPRLRVRILGDLPSSRGSSLLFPLADGLAVALGVEFDETVMTISDRSGLPNLDVPTQTLFDEAWRNTATELQRQEFKVRDLGGAWQLSSPWHFTTSLALHPEQALKPLLDRSVSLDDGVVFAAPNRHVVLVAALGGAGSLRRAVHAMAPAIQRHYRGIGPISPAIFLRDGNGFMRLAHQHEGRLRVSPSPEMQDRMRRGEV